MTGVAQGAADAKRVELGRRPPLGLAVHTRGALAGGMLDLRASSDELDFLQPNVDELWRSWIGDLGGLDRVLDAAADYGFSDPYGERRARTALAAHHGHDFAPGSVTFGAGITSLLRQLAPMANGGGVAVERDGHPDFARWACAGGASIDTYDYGAIEDGRLGALISERAPAVVVVDRPTVHGHLIGARQLLDLSDAASDVGAVVLVDEAYASYLGPSESLAGLATRAPRLLFLKGISKGYRMGGLRIGYAVASPDLGDTVRQLVSPLGVSTLPFLFALELLRQGDMFAQLRAHTVEAKARAITALERAGYVVATGHPVLPWVLIEDPNGSADRSLAERGIAVRRIERSSDDGEPVLSKLCVPLSDERWSAFKARLGT